MPALSSPSLALDREVVLRKVLHITTFVYQLSVCLPGFVSSKILESGSLQHTDFFNERTKEGEFLFLEWIFFGEFCGRNSCDGGGL